MFGGTLQIMFVAEGYTPIRLSPGTSTARVTGLDLKDIGILYKFTKNILVMYHESRNEAME